MISKDSVKNIVLSDIEKKSIFLVDVRVDASNKICVEIDKDDGITIDECVAVSRAVEAGFDREVEDFELEVSSPGLTQPFKVIDQYRKYCGRAVEVLKKDGQKINGIIRLTDNDGIMLEVTVKTKVKGSKCPQVVTQSIPLKFSDIKATKVTITF